MAKAISLDKQIEERWLKDPQFRKALKADPKATLKREFKLELPDKMKVEILEDTYDHRHIVLPGQEWNNVQLQDSELEAVAAGAGSGCCTCGRSTHQTFVTL